MRTRPRGMAPVPSQWLTTLKFMLNPLRVVLGLLRGAHLIQGTPYKAPAPSLEIRLGER